MAFRLAEFYVEVNALDKTAGALRGIQSRLGGFARTMSRATDVALFGGALTCGAGLAGAVREAIQMEDAMAGLAKATDLDPAGLAALKGELLGMSTALAGVPVENLLEIATTGAKLGIQGPALVEYTRGVAMLSTAMDDLPAGVIAEQMGKINSVFQLGQGATLGLGSAIDKLADSGVSSASGILNLTQRVSGTARALGLSADETVSFAAALLDTGTHAELGATSLQRLMQAMVDPEAIGVFARVLGVTNEEFARMRANDPARTMLGFLGAIRGMDPASQLGVLKGVGFEGAQGAGEIQKLAQQTETLARYFGLARVEMETNDQITKSYALTAETTSAQLTQFYNSVKILGMGIGELLTPAIRELADIFGTASLDIRAGLEGQESGAASWRDTFVEAARVAGVAYQNFGTMIGRVGMEAELKIEEMKGRMSGLQSWMESGFPTMIDDAIRFVLHEAKTTVTDTRDLLTGEKTLFFGENRPHQFGEGFETRGQIQGEATATESERRIVDIRRRIADNERKLADDVLRQAEEKMFASARARAEAGDLRSDLAGGGAADVVRDKVLGDLFGPVAGKGAITGDLLAQLAGGGPGAAGGAARQFVMDDEAKKKVKALPNFGEILSTDQVEAAATKAAVTAGREKEDTGLAEQRKGNKLLAEVRDAVKGQRRGASVLGPVGA